MKKSKYIMIWGSNLFLELHQNESGTISLGDTWSFKLKKHKVDNFSMKSLDSKKTIDYMLKILKTNSNYDIAIIELGLVDLINILEGNETIDVFKQNLFQIITILKYKGIKPIVFTLCPLVASSFKFKNNLSVSDEDIILTHKRINKVIKELAAEYEIDLIDDNKAITKKKSSYLNDDGQTVNGLGNDLIKNMLQRKIV